MADVDFSEIPTGIEFTDESISRLTARSAETATAFARKIEKLQSHVIDARERFTLESQPTIDRASPEDRAQIRKIIGRDVDVKVSELRRSLVKNSAPERAPILEQLARQAAEAETVASLCRSPTQMLTRYALGDPKRSEYQQQLAGAGPAELTTYAELALATGDRVLAAAVASAIDRRRKDKSFSPPFRVADFAQAVMGRDHAEINARLNEVRSRTRAARDLEREFVRGRQDPVSKIARGIAARTAAGETS